jgi:nucleotide-binding universal stress UspA family protein
MPENPRMDQFVPGVTRVLVATDRSETAERAVAFAAELASRYEAELVLLQVIVPVGGPGFAGGASASSEAAHAAVMLDMRAEELAGERGRARVVVDDDPAAAIIETAEEELADVVVVGNAGMTGRKEFLLANIPNRVSHNAHCTVVIVNSTLLGGGTERTQSGRLRRLLRRDE